jgi:hypothetical protein
MMATDFVGVFKQYKISAFATLRCLINPWYPDAGRLRSDEAMHG